MKKITIIGLGYVGLPLAIEFAKKFYNGGGHQNAAGGLVINEEITNVEKDLIKNFRLFCLKG